MAYLNSRAGEEKNCLSKYAKKSTESAGRKYDLAPDPDRTVFERDVHRILHSWPFRRLRNKTQVFYAPKNDHICTRLEHALHVSSISKTICKRLRLNCDLAEAISLSHDLGHPPFGHIGEDVLKRIHKTQHLPVFKHEGQSLRIIDRFKHNDQTLNLTYEVRDGVVCHCGEKFRAKVRPDRKKDITLVEPWVARRQRPATLEACVVRLADVISYLGRDFEDGVAAGIVTRKLPAEVAATLGKTNGEMTRRLIDDAVQNSQEQDAIELSDEVYSAACALKRFNTENIYQNKLVTDQEDRIDQMLRDMFYLFLGVAQESKRGKVHKRKYRGEPIEVFYEFLKEMQYEPGETDAQIVSDFVAGMTDVYATRVYQEMFLLIPPV